MLKKLFLASAILAGSTSAIAGNAPYVGAGIGIINNTANVKIDGTTDTYGAYRGVPFNLYAGYGGLVNQNFYLAAELNGTVGTANISNDNSGLKSTYGLGLSVIPGVMLSDRTMAYARAGIVKTRFPDVQSKTLTGGQFGLGLQSSVAQNVDIRGEYTFVAYQSKNFEFGSAAPRSDQFTLGLVYKFE